jgi:hypothetical protein
VTSGAPATAGDSTTPACSCSPQTAGSAGRAPVRATASRYSVSNLCLILHANPEASFVAGFKAWLELGYCVRKGEHAIWIFAPIPTRRRDGDSADDTDEPQRRVRFRAVPVFDRCQVEQLEGREPAPLEAPSEPLTGDSHAHLIEPAAAYARSLGYAVAFQAAPAGTGGWCDRANHRIVVNADAPPNGQLRILVHETAHALGIDYHAYTRHQADTSSAPASASRSTARASPTSPAGVNAAPWTTSVASPPRSTSWPARSRTPSAARWQPPRRERRSTAAESAEFRHDRSTLAGELLPSRATRLGRATAFELCLLRPHGGGVVPMHRCESLEPDSAPAARSRRACECCACFSFGSRRQRARGGVTRALAQRPPRVLKAGKRSSGQRQPCMGGRAVGDGGGRDHPRDLSCARLDFVSVVGRIGGSVRQRFPQAGRKGTVR